jgi:PIN domain nuclease of toxin-antitoxin system
VTVLDAFAVVAYLRDEPGAGEVAALLSRGPTMITATNVAEVLDQLVRVSGSHRNDVLADLALLSYAGMAIIPVTADDGLAAGQLRARHYHRERCAVSLADCTAAAVALDRRVGLATADPALAALVRAEGGAVHPLADSRGITP